MSKKIVVLTASPRKNGNSNKMAESFIKAATEQGHTVSRFDTAFMNVKSCTVCNQCYKNGNACCVNDDFNRVAAALEESDSVVFITPLYWYTFPAQLKSVIDKFYSFCVGGKSFSGKTSALISCCEENSLDAFSGMKFSYNKSIELLQFKSVGEVLMPAVNEIGDIDKTDGLKQVALLASQI